MSIQIPKIKKMDKDDLEAFVKELRDKRTQAFLPKKKSSSTKIDPLLLGMSNDVAEKILSDLDLES